MSSQLSGGIYHRLPADLKQALLKSPQATQAWQGISAIARNEWICWTISVKQEKTRQDHLRRAITELAEGKKHPCCWMGCLHRTDKPLGPWAQKMVADKKLRP